MARRSSSIQQAKLGIDRNIHSRYDNVKLVAENIEAVLRLSGNMSLSIHYLGMFQSHPTERAPRKPLAAGDFYLNLDTLNYNYYGPDKVWVEISNTSLEQWISEARTLRDETAANAGQASSDALSAAADAQLAEAARIAAENAANGSSKYHLWIVYADDENGLNASLEPDNRLYRGILAGGTAPLTSIGQITDFTLFNWEYILVQDPIDVFLQVSDGLFFKNNTGADKHITAVAFKGGAEMSSSPATKYRWVVNGQQAYVDVDGNFVQTTPTTGLYPADGDAVDGLNIQTIIVGASDVAFDTSFNLSCEVTGI